MSGALLPAGYDFRKGRTWQKVRRDILRRDRNVCQYCGGPAVEVDHVQPVTRRGRWYDPANLRASCRRCNAQRGNRMRGGRAKAVFRSGAVDISARTDNLYTRREDRPLRGDYSRKVEETPR